MLYDYIIIGGGLAGTYCAYKLSFKYKILLIEKENKLGGRGLMINWHQMDIKLGRYWFSRKFNFNKTYDRIIISICKKTK